MKKRVKIFGLVVGVTFVLLITFTTIKKDKPNAQPFAKVEQTDFTAEIEAKGEIEAGSSVIIYMPDIFFSGKIGMYEIKISELVPEGTYVEKGDYVATLDHTVVEKEISEEEDFIDKFSEELEVSVLDTTVHLSEQRNKIFQYKDEVNENKLILEQSIYESKAVQRKAEINVRQAERRLANTINNYKRMLVHEEYKVSQIKERLERSKRVKGYYEELKKSLKIYAPQAGLVMYARDYRRQKIKTGSQLNRYSSTNNRIALLPNLDSLISVTYINEIDITKVYVGQKVNILIDAVSENEFAGEVISIAKMGKKSREDGSKVFRVGIYILPNGSELKPSMSTTNRLMIERFEDVLVLPINTIYSENQKHYVYLKSGLSIVKKEVKLGMQDDKNVIVEKGLKKGDRCLIKEPDDLERIKVIPLKL